MSTRRPSSRPPDSTERGDTSDAFRAKESAISDDARDTHPPSAADGVVLGERGSAAVNRPPSLQSRATNVLAAGLMSSMAIGLIGWYYVHTFANRSAARQSTQATSKGNTQGEMVLPPLGRVDPPPAQPSSVGALLGSAPEELPALDEPGVGGQAANYAPATAYGAARPAPPTPEELAETRKLTGAVYASSAKAQAMGPGEGASDALLSESPRGASGAGGGDFDALLRPSATPAARAQVLPTQTLLLPKGAFIDCTLETAIDSTLSGMTTCVTATDTFGADGKVVLLERGTKLVGETRGQVRQGSARIFVLWTEARTPTGVVVPLASPGTDELGRSGLPGAVNRHFWERFGAAILISTINGAIQAEVQSQRGSGGTVVLNPQGSSDIVTEVLKSTVSIPPTVVKPQGDRIQVLVARDLDFRSVYALRVSP